MLAAALSLRPQRHQLSPPSSNTTSSPCVWTKFFDHDWPVEQALGGGTPQRIGWWRFDFDDERWEWSPEVEQIHGKLPAWNRKSTTELVLSHKHPEDYAHVVATLEGIRQTHKAFSTRHRIVTVQGDTREVVVIGERLHVNSGEIVGTQGFYIDVTPSRQARAAMVEEAVAEFADHRSAIEQVKNILMFVYRIDEEAAFELLRWRTRETNIKLRVLAPTTARRRRRHATTTPRLGRSSTTFCSSHQRVRAKMPAANEHFLAAAPSMFLTPRGFFTSDGDRTSA
jgi:ANTAR domain/PAS fold